MNPTNNQYKFTKSIIETEGYCTTSIIKHLKRDLKKGEVVPLSKSGTCHICPINTKLGGEEFCDNTTALSAAEGILLSRKFNLL